MNIEYDAWRAEEAERYLQRVRGAAIDVMRLREAVEVQRTLLPPGIDYSRLSVSGTKPTDSVELAAIAAMDAIREYCTELAAYTGMQREAMAAVLRLGNEKHRAVLALYYVLGHPWKSVAMKMGYTENHCMKLRTDALPLFWEVMPRGERTRLPRAEW